MPRKSLAEERTAQIIVAFEQCIARYGLEGSTLERIAEQAEMKRTILRHYIGNREDLVDAVAGGLLGRLNDQVTALSQINASEKTAEQLLELVLEACGTSSFHDVLIIEQFIAAAELYPEEARKLASYIDDFTNALAQKISEWSGSSQSSWAAAYGVVALIFNESSLVPLKMDKRYSEAAFSSAVILLESVKF